MVSIGTRIFHDARVGYQETGYIGPVLVEVCVNRPGYDGTGHIRTTAGEGVDRAVRIGTIEARDYGALYMRRRSDSSLLVISRTRMYHSHQRRLPQQHR